MIDALDPDDDGDGVPTREELGADPMNPRNSNGMVPMGEGMMNNIPDYLDPDDDGDGIPTRTERMQEGNMPADMDMIPAYLDRDSDGDGVPDSVERGPDGMNPANSDGMPGAGDRPDYLDLDSDNDCVPDADMREMGGARIDPNMPSMMANDNCSAPTPICDRSVGVCVPVAQGDAGADGGADASSPDDSGMMMFDSGAGRDVASMDATVRDGATTDGARVDGSIDGGASSGGLVSGDGACACRVPASPTGRTNSPRGLLAISGLGAVAWVFRRRSARGRIRSRAAK